MAKGEVLIRSDGGVVTQIDPGTTGQLLTSQGAGNMPEFADAPTLTGASLTVSAVDITRLERASSGLGVISGCLVEEDNAGAGMDVDVAAGVIQLTTGATVAVSAGEVTLDTADATDPRIDLVWVDTGGSLGKTTGTPNATPEPPSLSANKVLLALASVPATDTTITNSQITDKRTFLFVENAQTIRVIGAAASFTLNVNSTTYISLAPLEFSVDTSFFPFTHFRILVSGGSNAAAQTITAQLATGFGTPTTPVHSGGDDLVISNTGALYDSGYRTKDVSDSGLQSYIIAVKGSNSTVDLTATHISVILKRDI